MRPVTADKNLKISLVIPSLKAGGMERVMSEIAAYISTKGSIELSMVLYGRDPDIFYSVPSSSRIYRPVEKFNDKSRLLSTFKRLSFLRKTIKGINPDAILSFGEYWNSFVLLALLGLKFPLYISDRCSPKKEFSLFHRTLRKLLYPNAKGIIAQTKTAQLALDRQISHKNIKVIGNPVTQYPNLNPYQEREKIILSVGRLIETKHYDRLIKIFSRAKAPGWKLVIIGDNALKQDIKSKLVSLIDELNMSESIILGGKKSDIFKYYYKSNIFAFTSSSEGFPNVITEALSAGLPVISYDCVAGPSEMISDGSNGFLVPVFDDEQFLVKLQLLIDNENLRVEMAVKAPDSVRKFRIESIGEQYLDFIMSGKS